MAQLILLHHNDPFCVQDLVALIMPSTFPAIIKYSPERPHKQARKATFLLIFFHILKLEESNSFKPLYIGIRCSTTKIVLNKTAQAAVDQQILSFITILSIIEGESRREFSDDTFPCRKFSCTLSQHPHFLHKTLFTCTLFKYTGSGLKHY